ncbi:hypothetical protein C8R42DRAFT_641026 [Lentinula raphanica]|nr:hypothetical protein C8R42DRAFT_641026 [Lentinula raphanica]
MPEFRQRVQLQEISSEDSRMRCCLDPEATFSTGSHFKIEHGGFPVSGLINENEVNDVSNPSWVHPEEIQTEVAFVTVDMVRGDFTNADPSGWSPGGGEEEEVYERDLSVNGREVVDERVAGTDNMVSVIYTTDDDLAVTVSRPSPTSILFILLLFSSLRTTPMPYFPSKNLSKYDSFFVK